MECLKATDVRREFSSVVDMAVREKPVFISRTRDNLVLADIKLVLTLLQDCKLNANRYIEDDGSITLSLEEIDLIVNAPTEAEAFDLLTHDIYEYAHDYYDNYTKWSTSPNRRVHLPFVMKVLAEDDMKAIGAMISCRDGVN